jgi:hypothetical protein
MDRAQKQGIIGSLGKRRILWMDLPLVLGTANNWG